VLADVAVAVAVAVTVAVVVGAVAVDAAVEGVSSEDEDCSPEVLLESKKTGDAATKRSARETLARRAR
jgi:hypothetical protein